MKQAAFPAVSLAKKGLLVTIKKEASVDYIVDHTLARISVLSVRSSRILSKSNDLSDIERQRELIYLPHLSPNF
jgi:hypothetical protein